MANKENSSTLIKIEAIVREEAYQDVKNALSEIGVNGITVYQVVGCGVQRGMSEYVRGQKIDVQVLPKIKFEIVVSSEEWEEKTIETIKKAAYTGNPGDGKIFSYYIRRAVKIRTGETGYDAVQSTADE
ncbi:P-II family nitrogen regulator [Ruminococcus sp. Marseille-P6503]|uniref:P-II family nitrogen regulator n=1 Tax=Ruminococcus sp. Marseille-P6503 TaxID=2364796 RepID=UPI000F523B9C|nr:P-II family nitrogen regulator [Ruminococcus sp. Marseille-P6503]